MELSDSWKANATGMQSLDVEGRMRLSAVSFEQDHPRRLEYRKVARLLPPYEGGRSASKNQLLLRAGITATDVDRGANVFGVGSVWLRIVLPRSL